MEEGDVPQEFHLDTFIEAKLKKIEEEKKVHLFLPLWQNNIMARVKGSSPHPFSYRQTTKPSLVYGSVVNSRVHKGDFLYLEPPFAFVAFEVNASEVLRRILFGHIVTE